MKPYLVTDNEAPSSLDHAHGWHDRNLPVDFDELRPSEVLDELSSLFPPRGGGSSSISIPEGLTGTVVPFHRTGARRASPDGSARPPYGDAA